LRVEQGHREEELALELGDRLHAPHEVRGLDAVRHDPGPLRLLELGDHLIDAVLRRGPLPGEVHDLSTRAPLPPRLPHLDRVADHDREPDRAHHHHPEHFHQAPQSVRTTATAASTTTATTPTNAIHIAPRASSSTSAAERPCPPRTRRPLSGGRTVRAARTWSRSISWIR